MESILKIVPRVVIHVCHIVCKILRFEGELFLWIDYKKQPTNYSFVVIRYALLISSRIGKMKLILHQ